LTLKSDESLLNVAFKFNLGRYIEAGAGYSTLLCELQARLAYCDANWNFAPPFQAIVLAPHMDGLVSGEVRRRGQEGGAGTSGMDMGRGRVRECRRGCGHDAVTLTEWAFACGGAARRDPRASGGRGGGRATHILPATSSTRMMILPHIIDSTGIL
jgi:hypothetical protein